MSRDGWTQPICDNCWTVWSYLQFGGYRVPVRIRKPHREETECVFCGQMNDDGIFVRVDPTAQLHKEIESGGRD